MPKPSDQHGGNDGKQRRKAPTSYTQAGSYIGIGFQFAGTMVAGLLAGWWLDGKLSTEPAFLLAGTVLGAGTMVAGLLAGWWLDGKLSTEPAFLLAGTVLGAVAGFYHLYQTLVQKSSTPAESTDPGESEDES